MKTKGNDTQPGEQAAPTPPVAAFEAGSGAKRKKGPGGRRKSLIRLNSAKEIAGCADLPLPILPEDEHASRRLFRLRALQS